MQNKCLTTNSAQVHHIFVAANNGDTGLAAWITWRTTALKRFFYVRRMVSPQWAEPRGRGNPAGSKYRSANLHGSAHLAWQRGSGEHDRYLEHHTMATHAPSAPALRTTARPKYSPALARGPHRRIGRARPTAPSPVTALRAIVTETMDYPPVRPISADSFLPTPLLEAAQQALAAADRTARRPGRARLALSLYRVVRRLAGPVAAYRLTFAWSA